MKTKICKIREEYCVEVQDRNKHLQLLVLQEPSYFVDQIVERNLLRIRPESLGLSDSDFERLDMKKIGFALRNKIREIGINFEGNYKHIQWSVSRRRTFLHGNKERDIGDIVLRSPNGTAYAENGCFNSPTFSKDWNPNNVKCNYSLYKGYPFPASYPHQFLEKGGIERKLCSQGGF